MGESLPWDESVWLVEELLTDPTAHLTAALLDWEYPVSREWLVLASQHDLTVQLNTKKNAKPQRWPRPWRDETRKRLGHTTLSPDEARAELAKMSGRG